MTRQWLSAFVLSVASVSAAPVFPGIEQESDSVLRGVALLAELNCAACHDPEGTSVQSLSRSAPRLDTVGDRLDAQDIASLMRNPQALKPGTTMPAMFHGISAKSIDDLAGWLASLRSTKGKKDGLHGDTKRGRALYHSVGCVACHAPEAGFRPKQLDEQVALDPAENPSVPLVLGRHYHTPALVAFLKVPHMTRKSGRMPDFLLTDQEAADLASYLKSGRPDERVPVAAREFDVAKARAAFIRQGCAACHVADGPLTPMEARSLKALPAEAKGCLASPVPIGLPEYHLSGEQGTDLIAALASDKVTRMPPKQELRVRLAALNCYACHSRNGKGGLEPARTAFFHSVEEVDLGEEGRLPPALSGVGRKLKADALRKVVQGQGAVRPYMAARMPDFGAVHAAVLSGLLSTCDLKGASATPETDLYFYGRNPLGRKLAGTGDGGRGCITCHNLKGQRSLGIPAVDLATVYGRLQPRWFQEYLLDPQKFRPGTRMPPLFKDTEKDRKNIAHLWVYFKEIAQSRLPEGMEKKGSFELKPTDRPIVFRTFVEGAGNQAIAVGYPGGLNAVFDAQHCRWVLAWRGRFLDAESTWQDRFAPPAKPLGTQLQTLSLQAPGSELKFKGYRLRKDGVPVFEYEHAGRLYRDWLEPEAEGLKRVRESSGLPSVEERVSW